MANITRSKGQVYSVGNYLMTGKVLGKGHFARVEEATHRIIGKKVAIKIIDLTCIKEDYARRNLHREPRVMAKLRHPCIAALYETMMHGPRLYVVMEAAGGGDLCAHVLAARGAARGLPEPRARALAVQLVSAVRHMHARGVVHRDLKMENIMLDSTKQFIKIVDFGLSNVWSAGASLRTPCGSLEYAAPELFVDGRKYGPEVDLWSIGVIVFGMVTGGLPFAGGGGGGGRTPGAGGRPGGETAAGGAGRGAAGAAEGRGEGSSRPQLRAAIARGYTRKQRAALVCVSAECKTFIQQLLEPKVELRMKIEEAARHRWIKRPGMRMKIHPLPGAEARANREIYRQITELSGETILDVVAHIKADPFGAIAGMYNIKVHLQQMQGNPGSDLLWSANTEEPRPLTPPEYRVKYDEQAPSGSRMSVSQMSSIPSFNFPTHFRQFDLKSERKPSIPKMVKVISNVVKPLTQKNDAVTEKIPKVEDRNRNENSQSASRFSKPLSYGLKKTVFKVYDNGDGFDPRLPSIDEHSNADLSDGKKALLRNKTPCVRQASLDEPMRLNSCPNRADDVKRTDFYRKAGDGLQSWRGVGSSTSSARMLLQSNATTIKRASLGNIVSPHSSSNSHCKSEKAVPVGWYSTRNNKETHLQRLRRTVNMK